MLRKIFSKKTIKSVKNVSPTEPVLDKGLADADQPSSSAKPQETPDAAKQTSGVCSCPLSADGDTPAHNATAKLEHPANEVVPITLPIKTDIDKALKSALRSENSTEEPSASSSVTHESMFIESDESSVECSEEAVCDCYCYLDETPEDNTLHAESTIEIVDSIDSLKGIPAMASQFDLPSVSNWEGESSEPDHHARALNTKEVLSVIHQISEHLLKRKQDEVTTKNLTAFASQDGIRTENETFVMSNGERVRISMKRPTFVNTESLFQLTCADTSPIPSDSSESAGTTSGGNSRHVFINYDMFMGGDVVMQDGEEPGTSSALSYNSQDVVTLVKRTIEIENNLSELNENDNRLLSIQCFDKSEFRNAPTCADPKYRCGEIHERGVSNISRSWEFKDDDDISGMIIDSDTEYIVIKRIPVDGDELADDDQRAYQTGKCCSYKLTCGSSAQAEANASSPTKRTTLTLDIFTDPWQNGAFQRYFAADLDETRSSKFLRAVELEGSIKMTTFLEPNAMCGSVAERPAK